MIVEEISLSEFRRISGMSERLYKVCSKIHDIQTFIEFMHFSPNRKFRGFGTATFEELISLQEKYKIEMEHMKSNNIDWEQRRYEIAKEAIRGVALNADCFTRIEIETTVNNALELADLLIVELKKGCEQ